MPRVLVVGSINMDLVLEMERVPAVGENLLGTRYSYIAGGKGANQAVAVARLGADVTFVGRVGSDASGERLVASLSGERISTHRVQRGSNVPSGLAVIAVEKNGENRIVVYPGANMTLTPSDVEAAFEDDYDAVLFQLEMPDTVVAAVASTAKERNIPAILDAGPARNFDLGSVRGVTVISPNQSEAAALTGLSCDTLEQAQQVAPLIATECAAEFVVLKLGAQGALVHANGTNTHIPPFVVKAVDPTAAGDAFTAGLLLRWLATGDMIASARFANAAGALAASTLGAQPSLPTNTTVEEFLARQA